MATKDDLLSVAMRLSADERAEVAHELLLSLDAKEDSDAQESWTKELEARARGVLDGTARTRDARKALDEIGAVLSRSRKSE